MPLTVQQAVVLLDLFAAIRDAVKDCGDTGMPEGMLFLALQETLGIDLQSYNRIVDAALKKGVFHRVNHCLYYIEPQSRSKH